MVAVAFTVGVASASAAALTVAAASAVALTVAVAAASAVADAGKTSGMSLKGLSALRSLQKGSPMVAGPTFPKSQANRRFDGVDLHIKGSHPSFFNNKKIDSIIRVNHEQASKEAS